MGEIRPLNTITINELYTAWEDAFGEYIVQISKAELEQMLHRRSYDAVLSFGYFDEGRLVSFILNGIGEFRGQKTAYDTGTGTVKSHRKKGLASALFNAAVPHLKQAGVKQYLLEVLQDNAGAISIYKKLGFEVAREFAYYIIHKNDVGVKQKSILQNFEIKPLRIGTINKLTEMVDFELSWQNNNTALLQNPDDFVCMGVYDGDTVVGYGIIEPDRGDLPQLAVDKQYRRQDIGATFFSELIKHVKLDTIKLINIDISCESVSRFLAYHTIEISGKQFEMIKQLV